MLNSKIFLIKRLVFRWITLFIVLFIFSFPFPHNILPNLGSLLNAPFQLLLGWFGDNVLGIDTYTKSFDSDSTGLYIHVLLLTIFCFFIALMSLFIKINQKYLKISKNIFFVFIAYYLGSVLLMYGLDKIFKHQFYLPEPNILYTPLGDLSKDIAFWSVMGASRSYSVFSGLIEVIPALLLFFNRTRLLGALIGLMVLINVAMLNFGFDISVKIFSLFLVLLALIILFSKGKYLVSFFVLGKSIPENSLSVSTKNNKLKIMNVCVVLVLLSDSLYPYAYSNNFNDDLVQRPLYHGAYSVIETNVNGIKQAEADSFKNLFIHRQGYLILQTSNNNFIDYKLYTDTVKNQFTLVDYNKRAYTLNYYLENKKLHVIKGNIGNNNVEFKLVEQNWREMPLLQNYFAWTID